MSELTIHCEANELQEYLDNLPLVGMQVVGFALAGGLAFYDRSRMIDLYNNLVLSEGMPLRRQTEAIYEDEIPLTTEMTRGISANGYVIVMLDDGHALGIDVYESSKARILFSKVEDFELNTKVNLNIILKQALGETISMVKVTEMRADDSERDYVEDMISCPFKSVQIFFEDCMLYLSPFTCALMEKDTPLKPLSMTIAEEKEAVSYFSSLFDAR